MIVTYALAPGLSFHGPTVVVKAIKVDLADLEDEEQVVLAAGWEAFDVTFDWANGSPGSESGPGAESSARTGDGAIGGGDAAVGRVSGPSYCHASSRGHGYGETVRGRLCDPVSPMDDYFDDLMIRRQRLLFAIATRHQLERWESLVVESVRRGFAGCELDDADILAAEIEHHFLLIAARNLLRALEPPPASGVALDATIRSELIEGRDLREQWIENLPVFNVTPRQAEPRYRSGKHFAARNPDRSPYDSLDWSNKTGALVLPNVSALQLRELLDAVEAEVLAANSALGRFVPPRAPSPWLHVEGEWWPKPTESEESEAGRPVEHLGAFRDPS